MDLHTFKVLLCCELVHYLDHLAFETDNAHSYFNLQNLLALACLRAFLLSFWHWRF